jgi:hypothetical protein
VLWLAPILLGQAPDAAQAQLIAQAVAQAMAQAQHGQDPMSFGLYGAGGTFVIVAMREAWKEWREYRAREKEEQRLKEERDAAEQRRKEELEQHKQDAEARIKTRFNVEYLVESQKHQTELIEKMGDRMTRLEEKQGVSDSFDARLRRLEMERLERGS